MFTQILLATDGSAAAERATDYAARGVALCHSPSPTL